MWRWAYCTEGENEIEVGDRDGNGFTILSGSGYENHRLIVKVTSPEGRHLMGYAEIEVIPEAQIVIKREDGTVLDKDANGYHIAYLGDKLTAEVANVSQTFLESKPEWEWSEASVFSSSDSLKIEEEVFRNIHYCSVRVTLVSASILLAFSQTDVTPTLIDGNSFPITNAGTYKLKVSLNGDLADSYRLKNDVVTLTVNPKTIGAYSFDYRKPYKGETYDPYEFTLKSDYIIS